MDVQAFVSQRSVEGLYEGVVGRFAWSRKINPCSMMIRPQINQLTCKLSAVIGEQIFWCTSESNEPVENLNDVLTS